MRIRVFGIALLLCLVHVPVPAHAQGVVSVSVCNAGNVAFDVFLSQAGNVSGSHVGPADCAAVAETAGPMGPTYVGFAFADSRGQWDAPRRLDVLPYGPNTLSKANQNAVVAHGNANVSLPLPLLFRAGVPDCRTTRTEVTLGSNVFVTNTYCAKLRYALNVEAYPETREITFKQECDPCDKKANPQLTLEERAARQSRIDAANELDRRSASASLVELALLNRNLNVVDVGEVAARLSRLTPPQRVNWSELLPALRKPRQGGLRVWDAIPRYIVIRGTVSTVQMERDPTEPDTQWINVAFRESPDVPATNGRPRPEFIVCTPRPDVLQDVFGADFRVSMIGKAVEVEGESMGGSGGGYCGGQRGNLQISLARQVRAVQSAQFAPGTPVWVPAPPPAPDKTEVARAARDQFLKEQNQKHKAEIDACQQILDQALKVDPGNNTGHQKEYMACYMKAIGTEK